MLNSTLLARPPPPGCSVTPMPVPGVAEVPRAIHKLVPSFTCVVELHTAGIKSDDYKEDEET